MSSEASADFSASNAVDGSSFRDWSEGDEIASPAAISLPEPFKTRRRRRRSRQFVGSEEEVVTTGAWLRVDLEGVQTVKGLDIMGPLSFLPYGEYPEIVSQGYTLAPFEVSLYNTQLVPGGRDRLEEGMVVERITVQEGDGMERYDVYSWFSSEQGTEEIRADVVVITLLAPSADVELDMKELQVSEVKVWSTDFKHCEKSCRYGNCYQGRCVCWDGDFVGDDCSDNVLHAPFFLPPLHPLLASDEHGDRWMDEGDDEGWWSRSSLDALDRELEGLQNPSTCTTENVMTFSWDNTGLSAIVFYLSGLLHISMSYGKAMVVSDKTKFVFGHCPFNNFSCIFEDFSGCSAQSAREADNLHGSLPIHVEEPEDFSSQPVDLFNKRRRRGKLWTRMSLVRYIFRIKHSVQQSLRLRELRKDFNLTEPFIGWHVRLHVQDELRIGKCPNIEQHVQALRLVARRYKLKKVFVASDDPEVARQAQLLCPDLEFTSNLAFDRSILSQCSGVTSDCWLEGRVSRGEVHAEDMTRAWLVDVLMLSFSHVIVGQFGSNLSRLGYLLAIAQHKSILPFVSLDGPWRYSHLPRGSFA